MLRHKSRVIEADPSIVDVPVFTQTNDFGKLRQPLREAVLLDDIYFSGGDSATEVDIITEVGAR